MFDCYADALDKILRWRLVNMYGLDKTAAAELAHAVWGVSVDRFSSGGLQVPAFIH